MDPVLSFAPHKLHTARRSLSAAARASAEVDESGIPPNSGFSFNAKQASVATSRRNLFLGAARPVLAVAAAAATSVVSGSFLPSVALALPAAVDLPSVVVAKDADAAAAAAKGLVPVERVAALLRVVPTFSIVDLRGVPFMVVGEDAKVTGYFFTSYKEASRILKLASNSADKALAQAKRENQPVAAAAAAASDDNFSTTTNPWKLARISTVPLDTAVTLSLNAGRGNIRNYFQIAAASEDIEDALSVTGKDDLAEGKVPLFYYKDFRLDGSSPLYFQKRQLEEAYLKEHAADTVLLVQPEVLVTELFAVLTAMVKPGGTDTDLQTLVFVAPTDSAQRAAQCIRSGGKEAPFVLGQRNIVL